MVKPRLKPNLHFIPCSSYFAEPADDITFTEEIINLDERPKQIPLVLKQEESDSSHSHYYSPTREPSRPWSRASSRSRSSSEWSSPPRSPLRSKSPITPPRTLSQTTVREKRSPMATSRINGDANATNDSITDSSQVSDGTKTGSSTLLQKIDDDANLTSSIAKTEKMSVDTNNKCSTIPATTTSDSNSELETDEEPARAFRKVNRSVKRLIRAKLKRLAARRAARRKQKRAEMALAPANPPAISKRSREKTLWIFLSDKFYFTDSDV